MQKIHFIDLHIQIHKVVEDRATEAFEPTAHLQRCRAVIVKRPEPPAFYKRHRRREERIIGNGNPVQFKRPPRKMRCRIITGVGIRGINPDLYITVPGLCADRLIQPRPIHVPFTIRVEHIFLPCDTAINKTIDCHWNRCLPAAVAGDAIFHGELFSGIHIHPLIAVCLNRGIPWRTGIGQPILNKQSAVRNRRRRCTTGSTHGRPALHRIRLIRQPGEISHEARRSDLVGAARGENIFRIEPVAQAVMARQNDFRLRRPGPRCFRHAEINEYIQSGVIAVPGKVVAIGNGGPVNIHHGIGVGVISLRIGRIDPQRSHAAPIGYCGADHMPRTIRRNRYIGRVRQPENPERHIRPALRAAHPHSHRKLPDKVRVNRMVRKLHLRVERFRRWVNEGHPQKAGIRQIKLLTIPTGTCQTAQRIQCVVRLNFQKLHRTGCRKLNPDLVIRHRNMIQTC